MRRVISIIAISILPVAALAQGDVAKGEKDFRKCKSCHTIASADEVIVKGGRTGPNLYGVVGRPAGSAEFRYSKDMLLAGELGLIWDVANIVEFTADPSGFLQSYTENSAARSKMTLKAKNSADVAAYLATFSDAPAQE